MCILISYLVYRGKKGFLVKKLNEIKAEIVSLEASHKERMQQLESDAATKTTLLELDYKELAERCKQREQQLKMDYASEMATLEDDLKKLCEL